MNNYNVSELVLKEVRYNFTKPETETVTVSIRDNIEILAIFENQAKLEAKREMYFHPRKEPIIVVSYEVSIEHNEAITKDDLLDSLNKSINLVPVYSKISLLISQITNMSPIGPLVTPPSYVDEK